MTRQHLCDLLQQPAELPPAALLGHFQEQLKGLRELLQQDGLAKPVRNRAVSQLADLEATELQPVIAELEALARADSLGREIESELQRGAPSDVVTLLCRKLETQLALIPREDERLPIEKRLAEFVARSRPPAPPAVASTPPMAPAGEIGNRIDSYFAQIKLEQAKPVPAHGRVKLWLEKIEPLLEQVPQVDKRIAFEERLVEVQYWLKGESRAPWATMKSASPRPPATLPVQPQSRAASPEAPATTKAEPGPALPSPGEVLELVPRAPEGTLRQAGVPLRFVARARFVLGRQRSKTDFTTWFLPTSPENQQKTDSISRVNTTFFLKGSQIWVQDGEVMEDAKSRPSAGTVIDGQALGSGPVQLHFAKERRLRLGQAAYELGVVHLPATDPVGPMLAVRDPGDTDSCRATVRLSGRPTGCLRFKAISSREVPVMATWIFSEASIGADPTNAIFLEGLALPPVALRVFFAHAGFWIAVPAGSSCEVKLDEKSIAAGRFFPLGTLHTLKLGSLTFDLKITN